MADKRRSFTEARRTAQGIKRTERLIGELASQKVALIAYCRSKLEAGDWHAVQDAGSDIREIDAKLELLRML